MLLSTELLLERRAYIACAILRLLLCAPSLLLPLVEILLYALPYNCRFWTSGRRAIVKRPSDEVMAIPRHMPNAVVDNIHMLYSIGTTGGFKFVRFASLHSFLSALTGLSPSEIQLELPNLVRRY